MLFISSLKSGKKLEHESTDNFSLLRFYCDWIVHTKKDRGMQGIVDVAEKLNALVDGVEITSLHHEQLLKFLDMPELRKELLDFLSKHSLPNDLCELYKKWQIFTDTLSKVLSDQPIIYPIPSIKYIEIVSGTHRSNVNVGFENGLSTTSGFGK